MQAHVHRLRAAHADDLAAADRRRRGRACRGVSPRPRGRARAVRAGRAAGQLRRPAAARAAGPRGLAPADRGHGRHHRPLRQRLHPDLQAHRLRARLGPGAAALRRRHVGTAPDRPSPGLARRAGRAVGARRSRSRRDGAAADRAADRPVASGSTRTPSSSPAQTNAADLADQLRLLATKLAYPHWDPALFARFRAAALESFDLDFSSASARAGREIRRRDPRRNDQRWRPIEREEMNRVTVDQFRDFFTPLLAQGPVDAIIVGDIELEAAVDGDAADGRRRCRRGRRRRSRPRPTRCGRPRPTRSRAASPTRAIPTRPMR